MKTTDGLGNLVREARLRLGWTQDQLGAKLGVEKSYVSAIETGGRKWPNEYIGSLARALGLSQYEMAISAGLIEREADRTPVPFEDPRLRRIAERLRALSDAGNLDESDIQHIERVLALAEAIAEGKIKDEVTG